MENKLKILWVHNFERGANKGGIWMFNQHDLISDNVDLFYAKGLRNPINIISNYLKLRKLSKEYDIVHAQYGSAVGFLVGLLNCKKILTLRGSDWYKTKTNKLKDRIRIFIGFHFTRISLKFFYKNVIVVSNRFKNEIKAKYPKLNVYVFTTPLDLNKFKIENKPNNLQEKNVLFASVKIDNPVKRVQLAKKSFDLLKQKLPNVNWYVMNNIPHDEVNNFINKADVILLTSTHEGWPNVIKECLACNVPFVSTDVSDLKSIAIQTKNCFVVEEPKSEEIAIVLEKSLKQGKTEDLRKYVEEYDMALLKEKLYQIYNEIL